jgi:hypothetical protein
MSKNLIGYFRRSTVSMAAAIALSMGTVYLSIKGDMSSAMGAAGAAVAAFTASGGKDPEEEEKESIEKRRLDYQMRAMMLELAAQSNDPELLQRTIQEIADLQRLELLANSPDSVQIQVLEEQQRKLRGN